MIYSIRISRPHHLACFQTLSPSARYNSSGLTTLHLDSIKQTKEHSCHGIQKQTLHTNPIQGTTASLLANLQPPITVAHRHGYTAAPKIGTYSANRERFNSLDSYKVVYKNLHLVNFTKKTCTLHKIYTFKITFYIKFS